MEEDFMPEGHSKALRWAEKYLENEGGEKIEDRKQSLRYRMNDGFVSINYEQNFDVWGTSGHSGNVKGILNSRLPEASYLVNIIV